MNRSPFLCTFALGLAAAIAGATPVRFVGLGHIEYNQLLPGSTFYGQPGLPAITLPPPDQPRLEQLREQPGVPVPRLHLRAKRPDHDRRQRDRRASDN